MRSFLVLCFAAFQSFLFVGDGPVNRNVIPSMPPSVIAQAQSAMHTIEMANAMDGGRCTAEAIGPHTLLTASHCFVMTDKVTIDGDAHRILHFEQDDNDHLLLYTDGTFTHWLPVTQRFLVAGEQVVAVGNPGRSRDVTRFGYVDSLKSETGDDEVKRNAIWFVMFAAPGDSGSAIVDSSGAIVGVITGGIPGSAQTFSFELRFAQDQLAWAAR